MRLIDELVPAHFTLLVLLEDPAGNTAFACKVENATMGSMSGPVADVLGYDDGFVQMLSADLSRRELGEVPSGMMSAQGLLSKRTTDLGDWLLELLGLPVAGVHADN